MKPNVVTGIQPSGKLHIGNYLGALRHAVEIQNTTKFNCLYFIADLHSLTEEFNPKEKHEQIFELAVDLLASGLNPKKSTLFIQSQIPAHVELAWILNTLTPMGELSRMTQFKDKSKRIDTNVGLFVYPVLMASDILLYQPTLVPVGDDQLQHLELTRTLARKFNSKFGETFVEPKATLTQNPRVMSLDNPTKKMSKSLPKGCLYISDDEETIRQKIKSAVTDSQTGIAYDESRPGVANLIRIYSAFSKKTVERIAEEHKNDSYVTFKNALADVVVEALTPIRKKRAEFLKSPEKVEKIFEDGAKKASKIAKKTLKDVYQKIGIL